MHEPDLFASILPPAFASKLDAVALERRFAPNDLLYRFVVRGFGLIPGIDALFNGIFFDVGSRPLSQ